MALAGCSTHFNRLEPIRTAFFDGNLATADEHIEKELKKHKGEKDVLLLDKAIIELASGRPKEAERLLREVRDKFDELEGIDATKEVASMLTDDKVRPYAGEDYEKVLVRAMLSISNLMSEGGDAGAYALQVVDKQQQIMQAVEEKYKEENQNAVLSYKQVALGPYIRGMLAEESMALDDAVRARVQVAKWEPHFRDGKADIERCEHEVPMHPGNGALYVFALVGRGPIKQETAEIPTQAALLVADRIFDAVGKRNVTPTLAPVKIPQVVNFVPLSRDHRSSGRSSCDQEGDSVRRRRSGQCRKRITSQSWSHGGRRRMGSLRIGRHTVLGFAARHNPGLPRGIAGRRAHDHTASITAPWGLWHPGLDQGDDPCGTSFLSLGKSSHIPVRRPVVDIATRD